MKRLFLIGLLLFTVSSKQAKKPEIVPKKPVTVLKKQLSDEQRLKSYIPSKVPLIFLCTGRNPLDIQNAFMDTYDHLKKNEREKEALRFRLDELEYQIEKLKKANQ